MITYMHTYTYTYTYTNTYTYPVYQNPYFSLLSMVLRTPLHIRTLVFLCSAWF